MLQQMRKWSGYLKWLLVVVVFMFIVWGFATWTGGVGGSGAKAADDWAANVNGTVIEGNAFRSAARRMDSNFQQMFGDQYAQQRAFIRVGRQAIGQMIQEELIVQAARAEGLQVSPQELADSLTSNPSLQENGRFIGVERYRALFQSAGISMHDYEEQVRRDLLRQKFISLATTGVTVSDAEVDEELRHRLQKTSLDWVLVAPDAVTVPGAADDAALQAFYREHEAQYRRGEGRTGRYVLFDPQQAAAAAAVSDAEVKAAYDRDLPTRWSAKEQRRASHILFKVAADAKPADAAKIEAKAKDVLKRVKAGEDFAALAKKFSEDSTAANGGDLNFFGRGQMVKEFEEAAFALPVGGTSDLVKTTYGWHIIKVTDTRPGRTTPFEEVRDRIRQEMQVDRARGLATERAAAFAAQAKKDGFDAAVKASGLQAKETGAVRAGDTLAELPASQSAAQRILALPQGAVSDALPVPEGQIVVEVTGTLPDEPRPFAEVKAKVEEDWRADRRKSLVAERLRGAGSLESVAKAFKTEVHHQDDLAAGGGLPGVPADPAIRRQVETLAPGTTGDPIPTSAGLVVLRVTKRDDGAGEFASQRDATRDNLMSQRRDRLMRAMLRRLQDQGHVEINEPLVDSIDRSS
ncbi:MAG TPA: peptidyl-prolyl cis-trans isomerase [Candidatus Polarisedimenticolia bacterium]|nr:peptidyl-prolyl cis-trans isomerase [Candidatus Polarisedimenticolia bacterium]